jgi:hypothetical protein
MAFVIRSLATSALHLKRDRPPSHRGRQFRLARTAEDPDGFNIGLVAPPPSFDPELASLLRAVCLAVADTKGPASAAHCVLAGPTLAAWYHLGSQVPWKQHVCLSLLVVLRDEATLTDAGRWSAARIRGVLGDRVSAASLSIAPDCAVLEVSVRGGRKDRSQILLIMRLQSVPEGVERRDLQRVTIDGGNSGVFIPADARQLTHALKSWDADKKADVLAKLEMPPGWYWCPEQSQFVRPRMVKRALQWPPNVTTAKMLVALLVLVGFVYLMTMVMLPEWGERKRSRRATT